MEKFEAVNKKINEKCGDYNKKSGEKFTLSNAALRKLQEYDWPGNIRELENVIQRALCFTSAGALQPEDLHIDTVSPVSSTSATKPNSTNPHASDVSENPAETISAYENFRQMQLAQERNFLIKKIRECNGSVREAAQKLRIFRTALYNRLNHLGVNVKDL